jgi:preprotein translocase subunit SecG
MLPPLSALFGACFMTTLVLAVHIILAVILVALVLLQQGKGADVGAVIGGGANSLFGVGGASSVLVKMTTFIAIAFMLTSVLLVRIGATGGSITGSASDITEGLDVKALGGGEAKGVSVPQVAASAAPEAAAPVAAAPVVAAPVAAAPNQEPAKQ